MDQVKVSILGREYIITTKEDRARTEQVADFLNQYCKQVGQKLSSKSSINIITLAALHIANDYLKIKEEYNKLVKKIENKAVELDQVLTND
ncbi:MAG TPA: cell division protein ZapA [Deltaproteobacteria bacterium]|nr:MAG: hypothetical protein DRG83_20990 [Deltaproteobacteria bacterium]HDM78609.1 cell division protein ZapA [Deltaproteobacteria bacterium]HEC31205.1 cell division protein ZapA [Deltaproteobacteria bacterium]